MSGCLSALMKVLPWAGSLGDLICKGEIKKEVICLGLLHDPDSYLPPKRLGSYGLVLVQIESSDRRQALCFPRGPPGHAASAALSSSDQQAST